MLAAILISIFVLNVLFGYWRAGSTKFSLQWILAIHIPVIVGVISRLIFLPWNWALLPAFAGVFIVGQYLGSFIRRRLSGYRVPLSSFLVADMLLVYKTSRQTDSQNPLL